MHVTLTELEKTYWENADPGGFPGSPCEPEKLADTRPALARDQYPSALDLGCGDGAHARHVSPRCEVSPCCGNYIGLDGVARAVTAAPRAVPDTGFVRRAFPCRLPCGAHDLILLSDILGFLGAEDIPDLPAQILQCWPEAEIVCVTGLGETGHALQEEEALEMFGAALESTCNLVTVRTTSGYRIDRPVHREAVPQ